MITRTGIVSTVALSSLLLTGTTTPVGCKPEPQPSHTGAEAAGIAIIAGVVIGTVILVEVHKSHHTIKGCVSAGAGGLQLIDVNDKRTYALLGATTRTRPGDIVQLRGDKEKSDGAGDRAFVVKKMRKDYGPCDATAEPVTTSLSFSVVDATTHRPIAGATVSAAGIPATTDGRGYGTIGNLPAGTSSVTASAPGYDQRSIPLNLEGSSSGPVRLELQRHSDGDMEASIGQTGAAALYGVQFDTNSSTLRPDSGPTLNKALSVILNRQNSNWIIAGYTDNQGSADLNQKLSEARAASVVDWLVSHGVASNRLTAQGFGAAHPVADNATDEGRAKNRRVELQLVK